MKQLTIIILLLHALCPMLFAQVTDNITAGNYAVLTRGNKDSLIYFSQAAKVTSKTGVIQGDRVFYVNAGSGLDTLSTFSLNANDMVLFQRGGVWHGTITAGVNTVRYGSWGTGAQPVIDKFLLDTLVYNNVKLKNLNIQARLYNNREVFVFQTGFESTSVLTQHPTSLNQFYFTGTDNSLLSESDWNLTATPYFYSNYINNGNDSNAITANYPLIITDPTNSGNKVLQLRATTMNEIGTNNERKFRSEHRVTSPNGMNEIDSLYYTTRVYFPTDWQVLKNRVTAVPNNWLTVTEFYNDPAGYTYPFSLTITACKFGTVAGEINFGVRTQSYLGSGFDWITHFNDVSDYAIPLNKWLTLEVNIIDGDAQHGKFYFAVIEDGIKTVLWDTVMSTRHLNMPSTNGNHYWYPHKIYTAEETVDSFRVAGKELKLYWDDFKLYDNRWVGNAVYTPYPDDAKHIGYEIEYANIINTNERRAMPVTFTEDGKIYAISMYHGATNGSVIYGVYDDDGAGGFPATRLATTPVTTAAGTEGWQTINLTDTVAVSAGQTVWLAWIFSNNTTTGLRYMAGAPGRIATGDLWTTATPLIGNNMSDPFAATTQQNTQFAIFCIYKKQD